MTIHKACFLLILPVFALTYSMDHFGAVFSDDSQYNPRNVSVTSTSCSILVSWEPPLSAVSLQAYIVSVYPPNVTAPLRYEWVYQSATSDRPLRHTLQCLGASSAYRVQVLTVLLPGTVNGSSHFMPVTTNPEAGWFSKMADHVDYVFAGAVMMLLVLLVAAPFIYCCVRMIRNRWKEVRLTGSSQHNENDKRISQSSETALPSAKDLRTPPSMKRDDNPEYRLTPLDSQPRPINNSKSNKRSPLIHSSPPTSYQANHYSSSLPKECAPSPPVMATPSNKGKQPFRDDDIYDNEDEIGTGVPSPPRAAVKPRFVRKKIGPIHNVSINAKDEDFTDLSGELYENNVFGSAPGIRPPPKKANAIRKKAYQESPIYENWQR